MRSIKFRRCAYVATASISLALAGCVLSSERADFTIMLVNPNGSALERLIIDQNVRNAHLNESAGYRQGNLVVEYQDSISEIVRHIESRINRDLRENYDDAIQEADRTYVLVRENENRYIIFVVRVKDVRADGVYTPLPGLIYEFSQEGSNFISVIPTTY